MTDHMWHPNPLIHWAVAESLAAMDDSEEHIKIAQELIRRTQEEERERCARIVEDMDPGHDYDDNVWSKWRAVDLIRSPKGDEPA